jgi:hypothetical protein
VRGIPEFGHLVFHLIFERQNVNEGMKYISGIPFNRTNSTANPLAAKARAQARSLRRDEQRRTSRT